MLEYPNQAPKSPDLFTFLKINSMIFSNHDSNQGMDICLYELLHMLGPRLKRDSANTDVTSKNEESRNTVLVVNLR